MTEEKEYDGFFWFCRYKALKASMIELGRIRRREKKEMKKEIQRLKQKIFDLEKLALSI